MMTHSQYKTIIASVLITWPYWLSHRAPGNTWPLWPHVGVVSGTHHLSVNSPEMRRTTESLLLLLSLKFWKSALCVVTVVHHTSIRVGEHTVPPHSQNSPRSPKPPRVFCSSLPSTAEGAATTENRSYANRAFKSCCCVTLCCVV